MASKEEKIKLKLSKDPGNPVFSEFAEYLRKKKRVDEAFQVCFEGLSQNPSHLPGRLVLARLFYASNWIPFAVRELELIHRSYPENATLIRLLQKLDPDFVPASDRAVETGQSNETMIAETEFDLGDIDLLDD
jgi:predicted Zn-dependent protease